MPGNSNAWRDRIHSTASKPAGGFDEWLRCERDRLREVARGMFAQILLQQALDPNLDTAIATALRLIRLDPFDEAANRNLMLLYVRQGRASRAIRHFHWLARCLRQELGIPPDQETAAPFEAICVGRGTSFAPTSLLETTFVLEQVPQCIVVTDLASQIVGWSKAAEREFGFTKVDSPKSDWKSGRPSPYLFAARN